MTAPRPAYGEYASPEEQARRMGVDPQARAEELAADAARRREADERRTRAASAGTASKPRTPLLAPVTGARRVDRFIAIVLLAWGLVSVVRNVPALTDLPSFFYEMFDMWGVDAELSDPTSVRWWGVVAAFVLGIGWLLTAVLTWMRTRRGRIAFWLPLVGAVVTMLIVSVLVSVPLASDPALMQSMVDQMEQITVP